MNTQEKWWKESVVYQIYPRSFKDSNGDGIGDLKGITEKLDYLCELGVDVIWLSPIYQSPNDDNGYDISDYRQIMKEFGEMKDFDELLSKAHDKGLKILMDLVVNHTSDEHQWFVESRSSKDNRYRDYYIWKETKDGKIPNNWGSCFEGSAWEYDETTKMYYLHLFSKKQPDLNWDNPVVRQEIYDMMNWWLDKGIDGFRMDVISLISKDPSFPDGTPGINGYSKFNAPANGPHVHEYLQEMRRKVLNRTDNMTVGECTGVTLEEARKYARADGKELSMIFQFKHMNVDEGKNGNKWESRSMDLRELKHILTTWQKGLEGVAWNSLFWSNHDQPRVVSRFGTDGVLREHAAKMLATCLHMMQGTPYIYQGEELGMTNVPFTSINDFRDLDSINAYHELVGKKIFTNQEMMEALLAKSRDNARTPFHWDDSINAGFTNGTPWIMVNPNYVYINAKEQIERPDSVFHYYQKLIQLRKSHKTVIYGTYELLMPESEQLYAYTRTLAHEQLLVICNFSGEETEFCLPEEFKESTCLISNYEGQVGKETQVLRPYEAFVLKKKDI